MRRLYEDMQEYTRRYYGMLEYNVTYYCWAVPEILARNFGQIWTVL